MAWTTMHFAAGMGCAGVATGLVCAACRRGWRWIPATMTLGGVWALVPDMPRIFREDIYWEPLSSVLGNHSLERNLHAWGDLFFFHRQLDQQPREYALLGLAIVLILYNASIFLLMCFEYKHRNSLANRAWRAHRSGLALAARRQADMKKIDQSVHSNQAQGDPLSIENDPAVIYRIRPSSYWQAGDTGPA